MSWLWSCDVNTACLEVRQLYFGLTPDRGSALAWFWSICYIELVMKTHISVAQPKVFFFSTLNNNIYGQIVIRFAPQETVEITLFLSWLWVHVLCRFLVSGFVFLYLISMFCIMSFCVLCLDFSCPYVSFKFPCVFPMLNFHAFVCLLPFKCVLPSVSLCLSVFSSMPSPCYLTCWSTSPVPRLVISVCVFSLCLPCTPLLVIVSVPVPSHVSACFQSPPWYVFLFIYFFLDLSFAFCLLIWTLFFVCTLFDCLLCYFGFLSWIIFCSTLLWFFASA